MPMLFSNWLSVILWAAALVVLLAVEANTFNLVTIWFAVGALAALITSLFSGSFTVQLLVFAVVSAVSLALSKPLMDRMRRKKASSPVGLDRDLGRRAVVLTPILPGEPGRVRLDGVDWQAVSDVPMKEGQRCIVREIRSTTLRVEPLPEEGV